MEDKMMLLMRIIDRLMEVTAEEFDNASVEEIIEGILEEERQEALDEVH